jgi:hypothetical protein
MNTAIDILAAVGGLIGAISGAVAFLSWINTRKAEKKKADAEANNIVQTVYERLIKSLDERITKIEQRECLRDDCSMRIR